MTEIKDFVVRIEHNKVQVLIDLSLYQKEVILSTIYRVSDFFYVHQQLDPQNSKVVIVTFESKDGKIVSSDIAKQFCNNLVDEQVRYNTNLQFGHIRDMIVEEAFKPVTPK